MDYYEEGEAPQFKIIVLTNLRIRMLTIRSGRAIAVPLLYFLEAVQVRPMSRLF